MDENEATRVVGAHQAELSRAKFEQETQRDKTLVLVSGGALTVSFAFISSLMEHSRVFPLLWLVLAWASWVGVLTVALTGYTLSIAAYERVIQGLSRGNWEVAHERSRLAQCIEPLNIVACALVILGFISFGWFTTSVLRSTMDEKVAWERRQASAGKEIQGRPAESANSSKLGAGAAVPLPAAPKE